LPIEFYDDEDMKKYSTFSNNKIKENMIESIIWGKPNIRKLSFGYSPLFVFCEYFKKSAKVFSDYKKNLKQNECLSEKLGKNKNAKQEYESQTLKILNENFLMMNEINFRLSNYFIIDFCLNFKNLYKKNSKKKTQSNSYYKDLISENFENINFGQNEISNLSNNKKKKSKENKLIEQGQNTIDRLNIMEDENNNFSNQNKFQIKSYKRNYIIYSSSVSEETSEISIIEKSENKQNFSEKDIPDCNKGYKCEFCGSVFSNGQGLGGHMSRKHPNQSEKYKFKKETREKRNLKREYLYKAQRILLCKFNYDYDRLRNYKEGRKIIKKVCKDYKNEYYKLKKEVKVSRNLNIRQFRK